MTKAGAGRIVATEAGRVRGQWADGAHVFKGIPYGASTAGAARFMPPKPPLPWTGLREAAHYGPRSPGLAYPPHFMHEEGVDLDSSAEGEDCLVLNIWTPEPSRGTKRPVMVWCHGGGYNSGSGGSIRYDGTRLAAAHDVVVVTLNHRLGALGFLYFDEIDAQRFPGSANLGMQDIVRALEWVRDNIEAFGGDPGCVTVFGESGGGGKVSTLMAMPAARGLFHRVISQSGSGQSIATPAIATQLTRSVLDKLGVDPHRLDSLMTLPAAQIAAATPGFIRPVVDGTVIPHGPFDPGARSMASSVPFMAGSTLTEVTFFNSTPLESIDGAELMSRLAAFTGRPADALAGLVALYREHRPGVQNHHLYQLLASDWWMTCEVHAQAASMAARGDAPVYVYQFTMAQGARGGKLDVPHTAEIAYAFDNLLLSTNLVGEITPQHALLASQVSSAWVAFARTGDPNVPGLPRWERHDSARRHMMILDGQPRPAPPWIAQELAAVSALKAG